MVQAGMDVARLNLSHGNLDSHRQRIEMIREIEQETGHCLGILADLCGPKIRIGRFTTEPVQLNLGQTFTITTRPILGDHTQVSCTYAPLARDVKPGQRIFLADGLIHLEVSSIEGADVHCRVLSGGSLTGGKGLNLPGAHLSTPSLTAKDLQDLEGILPCSIDFIALSFVRTAQDIVDLRKRMKDLGKVVPIVAKIEKPEAIENLDEILKVTDIVMVARGDLGVETSVEAMPMLQKRILFEARKKGVPSIVATQMLESMTVNPQPTRAEATDVANAILDGTDAVMLSGETASGPYPVAAVQTMARIIAVTESQREPGSFMNPCERESVEAEISHAVAELCTHLKVKAIALTTRSGTTAKAMTKYRPQVPILVLVPNEEIARRIKILWGSFPILAPYFKGTLSESSPVITDEERQRICSLFHHLIGSGLITRSDLLCLVSNVPRALGKTFNSLHLVRSGDFDQSLET
jgi:pyruvate kinase